MITLMNEFYSFETLIKNHFTTIELLAETKKEPTANQAVFLLVGTETEELNRAMVRRNRSYQLIFYAEDMFKAMELHGKVDQVFSETENLACEDRFIKLEGASLSRVFTTDSKLHSFICMVEASYSLPRSFEEAPKMANIGASVYNENGQSTWADVEVNPVEYEDINDTEWVELRSALIKVAETK